VSTSSPARTWIAPLFDELVTRHGVVGASLAVLDGDDIHTFATGIANLRTGHAVTPETLFMVGSTTKSFTATLVLQLVEEGRVDLDLPLSRYVAAPIDESITPRQLLSHTSGLDNGPYTNHGRGEDAVSRYVDSLTGIPPISPPGERFTYSNAGFVILGRLVEEVTGLDWDTALRTRLLHPGGLEMTFTLPEMAAAHAMAIGHERQAEGVAVPGTAWAMAAGRAMGPTGSTLTATAADLVRFARLHMEGGGVVSKAVAGMMRVPHASLPAGSVMAQGWGLGLLFEEWQMDGQPVRVFGHTGHNEHIGSFLRFLPQSRAAAALVFNSAGDAGLFHDLFSRLFSELYGVHKPPPWLTVEPGLELDLSRYAGVYRRHGMKLTLRVEDDGLLADVEGSWALQPYAGRKFRPASSNAFGSGLAARYTVASPEGTLAPELVFDGFDAGGRPRYVYTAVFAARRE